MRSNQLDKALQVLKEDHSVDFTTYVNAAGYNCVHIAAAAGHLELMVEMLSRGLNFSPTQQYVAKDSGTGNTPLHVAALNNCKAIMEILLRSNADASVPNSQGLCAIELTSSRDCQEVLLRARCSLLSPQPLPTVASAPIPLSSSSLSPTVTSVAASTMVHQTPMPAPSFSSSSGSIAATAISSPLPATSSNYTSPTSSLPFHAKSVDEAILEASKDTANVMKLDAKQQKKVADVFKGCNPNYKSGEFEEMKRLVTANEDYAVIRCGLDLVGFTSGYDGATPLHCAAKFTSAAAVKFLLTKPGVSAWARDLQGRTPLHLAVANQQNNESDKQKNVEDICMMLRDRMLKESSIDPVGEHAPVDATGTTPLGWSTKRENTNCLTPIMKNVFLREGDRSIYPHNDSGSSDGSRDGLVYAKSEAQGWKMYMEDRIMCCPNIMNQQMALFGILDGHGGEFSADFLCREIPLLFIKELAKRNATSDDSTENQQPDSLLIDVCRQAEAALKTQPRMMKPPLNHKKVQKAAVDTSGSTLVAALVTPSYISVANVGDSRAMLGVYDSSSSIKAVALSEDHKCHLPEEQRRILNAGCVVKVFKDDSSDDGAPQYSKLVLGKDKDKPIQTVTSMSMSRAFGDFVFKENENAPIEEQALIAVPEIRTYCRTTVKSNDKPIFLLLACDGVFDVMSNDEVVSFVAEQLGIVDSNHEGIDASDLSKACDALLKHALKIGADDNLSVLIVSLLSTSGADTSVDNIHADAKKAKTPASRDLALDTKSLLSLVGRDGEVQEGEMGERNEGDGKPLSPIQAKKLFAGIGVDEGTLSRIDMYK